MKQKKYSYIAFTALIIAFLIHNIEEAYMICSDNFQSPVSFIQAPTCKQFLWIVSFVSIAGIIAYIIGLISKKSIIYILISTWFAAILLINVFIPHVILALYTKVYTPGLISALLLTLPTSISVLIINRKFKHSKK